LHQKAVACHEAQYALATELGLAQAHAALDMGVALALQVWAGHQGLLLTLPKLLVR
jgi:hypothetical protein